MTISVKWDLYGSTRRYATTGGTEKRLDRVVRRCRIDGIDSGPDGLDESNEALMTGVDDVWRNPYSVQKRWVESVRWGPTRAWGTVVHDRGGQGGGTVLLRDTRVRFEWRESYRVPSEFLNAWPNGRMRSDNGSTLPIDQNPIYFEKDPARLKFAMYPAPVSQVLVRTQLTFDPWGAIADLVGHVNSTQTTFAGYAFPAYSIRLDGADIQTLLIDNLPRWRVVYEMTFNGGAHFDEVPIRQPNASSPTGWEWQTQYLIAYPAKNFTHIPVA